MNAGTRRAVLRLSGAVVLAAGCAGLARAGRSDAEQARIDRLIDAVGKRTELRFIRNGSEYSSENAAAFLRRKLVWTSLDIATCEDFIDKVASRSTTSGEVYLVKLSDGRTIPSSEFMRLELVRLERK